MPDNHGARGRARTSSAKPYDMNYFAQEHHFSQADAEKIIKQVRRNRERANEMAVRLLITITMQNALVRSAVSRAH